MSSQQTLSLSDRRVLSAWAADCAEHVLPLFEAEAPVDARPRTAIAAARAFARGTIGAAEMILQRGGGKGPRPDVTAAAAAAGRAAGQALATAHMGAHALGAAGYACHAALLAAGDDAMQAWSLEMTWQLAQMSLEVRAALRRLPALGEPGGPLGPGLLSRGPVGDSIRHLQEALTWT
ncbi:putative immunity protein [Propioniciclava tarda]|uniref:Imm-5-like domain-containing protein n=1 Tax=Propioniciclava tarda TaxID=433330 RepID=A0A4Q9KL42_PROTD|nr:hypothetical protein ET996_06815 [Propioniciclava tarda]